MDVLIRLADPNDATLIAAIYGRYVESSHFTFEEMPPGTDEIATRIANPLHPWLVAEEARHVIGYASTSPMRNRAAYRWGVETGIYLEAGAVGRGIGQMLLAAHLAMLERQGFVTAIAGIALPNDASVALHQKLGFTFLGVERGVGFKFGRWIDVGRWQRDLAPRTNAPTEPLTSAAVQTLA